MGTTAHVKSAPPDPVVLIENDSGTQMDAIAELKVSEMKITCVDLVDVAVINEPLAKVVTPAAGEVLNLIEVPGEVAVLDTGDRFAVTDVLPNPYTNGSTLAAGVKKPPLPDRWPKCAV